MSIAGLAVAMVLILWTLIGEEALDLSTNVGRDLIVHHVLTGIAGDILVFLCALAEDRTASQCRLQGTGAGGDGTVGRVVSKMTAFEHITGR